MTSPQPRIGVVRFPGSNDDRDALWALAALDAEPVAVWHSATELPDLDAVVLPGGFSYGDYLRCGAISRFAPVMTEVRQGKRFELEVAGEVTEDVLEQVRQMAETLLSNPVIEDFVVHVEESVEAQQ